MYSISFSDGGATFKTMLHLKASSMSYEIFAPASEYSLSG